MQGMRPVPMGVQQTYGMGVGAGFGGWAPQQAYTPSGPAYTQSGAGYQPGALQPPYTGMQQGYGGMQGPGGALMERAHEVEDPEASAKAEQLRFLELQRYLIDRRRQFMSQPGGEQA